MHISCSDLTLWDISPLQYVQHICSFDKSHIKLWRALWNTLNISVIVSESCTVLWINRKIFTSANCFPVIKLELAQTKDDACSPHRTDIAKEWEVTNHLWPRDRFTAAVTLPPLSTEAHTATLQTDHGGVVARKHLGASSHSIWPD